jgi:hypothetical protein
MGYFSANYFGGGTPSSVVVPGGRQVVDLSGSMYVMVGSSESVSIECNQDVSELELTFYVETKQKLDVDSILTASIVKELNYAELTITSLMTTEERTLLWSLVNDDNGESVAAGLMFVTYDAEQDQS